MKLKQFYLLVFITIIFTSCLKDSVEPIVTYPNNNGGNNPSISFSTDIQPTLTSNCAAPSCHGAGSSYGNFVAGGAYNEIISKGMVDTTSATSSILYTKINTGGSMAVYSNASFKAKVLQWINEGAKNN